MNIQEIIAKKRDAKELNKMEIDYFVREYSQNNIPDYQAAALIMAICINGMNEDEIINLTSSMANSGDTIDLSKIGATVVDKHSTGGVGDKVTLILMPIMAALGVPVAKMSGRGLGFTGGTVDKLQSIPGYRTDLSEEEFIENVKNIGISLIGQTANLVPADKKIYALRDTIACTKSTPLIASSIMSKKIAAGADKIVLDITVGSGAFMKNKQEAMKLAHCMKRIGELAQKETICILTNMEEPLGYNIGNILEVIEATKCLRQDMPADVKEVVETMGAYMLKLAGKGDKIEENVKLIQEVLESGKAYEKWLELVKNQGGDISYLEDSTKFGKAKFVIPVLAQESGYITAMNAERIGNISVYLGAGRNKKEDKIDPLAGIELVKKIGDSVETGEALAYIHTEVESKIKGATENLIKAFEIGQKKVKPHKNIIAIVK